MGKKKDPPPPTADQVAYDRIKAKNDAAGRKSYARPGDAAAAPAAASGTPSVVGKMDADVFAAKPFVASKGMTKLGTVAAGRSSLGSGLLAGLDKGEGAGTGALLYDEATGDVYRTTDWRDVQANSSSLVDKSGKRRRVASISVETSKDEKTNTYSLKKAGTAGEIGTADTLLGLDEKIPEAGSPEFAKWVGDKFKIGVMEQASGNRFVVKDGKLVKDKASGFTGFGRYGSLTADDYIALGRPDKVDDDMVFGYDEMKGLSDDEIRQKFSTILTLDANVKKRSGIFDATDKFMEKLGMGRDLRNTMNALWGGAVPFITETLGIDGKDMTKHGYYLSDPGQITTGLLYGTKGAEQNLQGGMKITGLNAGDMAKTQGYIGTATQIAASFIPVAGTLVSVGIGATRTLSNTNLGNRKWGHAIGSILVDYAASRLGGKGGSAAGAVARGAAVGAASNYAKTRWFTQNADGSRPTSGDAEKSALAGGIGGGVSAGIGAYVDTGNVLAGAAAGALGGAASSWASSEITGQSGDAARDSLIVGSISGAISGAGAASRNASINALAKAHGIDPATLTYAQRKNFSDTNDIGYLRSPGYLGADRQPGSTSYRTAFMREIDNMKLIPKASAKQFDGSANPARRPKGVTGYKPPRDSRRRTQA